MFDDDVKTKKSHRQQDFSEGTLNLCESLITAFIMALVIVVFVVQPYIIPTGSMADTLRGAHFRMRCSQCGYKYDRNFESRSYGYADNSVPKVKVQPPARRCPSCGYYEPTST
ncbi:MAG: S26 family signal peptidase, partial [Planctomycetota bacterium]